MEPNKKIRIRGTKRKFIKLGGCSHLQFHILNRQFGQTRVEEELASNLLAGGILQQGYQCGMLWGASMAAGTEAYRRCKDMNKATALTIKATQMLMESFKKRTGFHDCYDIAECDWKKKSSLMKYFVKGKFVYCFKLAQKWAPEAVETAFKALDHDQSKLPDKCMSCASELARKMKASEEQMCMLAGFAGGLGLSGNACGALAAAIWLNTISYNRKAEKKNSMSNHLAEKAQEVFYKSTNYEVLCKDICGKRFETLNEHTDFVSNGGCKDLIDALAKA